MQLIVVISLCVYFVSSINGQDYEIPDGHIRIEALHPKGLRVSIPDEEGIELFAFHGKINEPMNGREAGVFSQDIHSPVYERWTFFAKNARLKLGDVLYYWLHVKYEGIGYEKDGKPFTITELIAKDGSVVSTTSTATTNNTVVCIPGDTKIKGKTVCKGELVFHDSFSTSNAAKWKPEIKFPQEPDFEFVIYQDDPQTLFVEDKYLHISPKVTDEIYGTDSVFGELDLNERCTGLLQTVECIQTARSYLIIPPVVSAKISTIESFSFLYGTIEVKAKLPKGDWLYPEISLVPKTELYGSQYDSGRIRIAMAYGNREYSNDLYAGGVLGTTDAARNYAMKKLYSDKHWTDSFHVFRVEWKPDSIIVKVDGTVFGAVYPPAGGFATDENIIQTDPSVVDRWRKGTILAPFDQEMYVTLGVGVAGQCFPNSITDKPWVNGDPKAQLYFYRNQSKWKQTWDSDSQLFVEYVKVWGA